MIEQSHHAAESETSVAPTFGASGEEDITYIPVTGSSPRENYDVLVGHNLLKKIPDILGNTAHKILVIHPRAPPAPANNAENPSPDNAVIGNNNEGLLMPQEGQTR